MINNIPSSTPLHTSHLPVDETVEHGRILIVDDNEFNREILGIFLTNNGWTHIAYAENGEAALGMLDVFIPDLILLDLSMPIMDGFTFCQKLREMPAYKSIPVIVETAMTGMEDRRRAFAVGATDFITKPIFQEEMIARVRLHLQNRFMLKNLGDYYDRVSSELAIARTMQAKIMPDDYRLAAKLSGIPLDVAAYFQPTSELGGDIWGMRRLSDTQALFYCGDFSGHGVGAAINTFRLHMMIETTAPNVCAEPATLLYTLNTELHQTLPRGQYLAIFVAIIDTQRQEVRYSSSSMPNPILFHSDGTATQLKGSGLPLGISAQARHATSVEPFKPGDSLILFSDALVESRDASGQSLSQDELVNELVQSRPKNADETLQHIMRQFTAINPITSDDLTLVCVNFKT